MIDSKSEAQLKIKVVLIGDSGVGKTNIKNRFCRGSFRQYSNPTVGIQLASRKFWGPFEDKQSLFELVFWDIGASNYDQSILPTYFRNAFGVIYVYQVTRRQTFQRLQSWRELVLKYMNTQNYTEMVIGNKTDLLHFRQVLTEEVEKWSIAKRIRLFFQTSALQNLYIQDAMAQFAKVIVEKFDQTVRKPLKLDRKQPYHRGCI